MPKRRDTHDTVPWKNLLSRGQISGSHVATRKNRLYTLSDHVLHGAKCFDRNLNLKKKKHLLCAYMAYSIHEFHVQCFWHGFYIHFYQMAGCQLHWIPRSWGLWNSYLVPPLQLSIFGPRSQGTTSIPNVCLRVSGPGANLHNLNILEPFAHQGDLTSWKSTTFQETELFQRVRAWFFHRIGWGFIWNIRNEKPVNWSGVFRCISHVGKLQAWKCLTCCFDELMVYLLCLTNLPIWWFWGRNFSDIGPAGQARGGGSLKVGGQGWLPQSMRKLTLELDGIS